MINLTIAKNAGFCFGVKRAIDEVNKLLDDNKKIYCIGEIIHNSIVINKLKDKGLIIIDDEKEIYNLKSENVIIRAHGIDKNINNALLENKNNIYDLTCPFVKKIHNIVSDNTKNNETLIIIGDKNHPEVKGIKSYAHGEYYIINTASEAKNININKDRPIVIVSQTTTSVSNFQNIVDILSKIFYNYKVFNTICESTENRQKEASMLSKNSDVLLVIGSKKSSNSIKLYDICSKNAKTYFIENKNDIDNIYINDKSNVSIVAGASTPLDLIEEISLYARSKF